MKNRIVTIVSMIFLAVLCFGGCGNTELEERNRMLNQFIQEGAWPDSPVLEQQMRQTAHMLSQSMLYWKFVQGIPLVGAVGGAWDAVCLRRVQRYAAIKYSRRFLIDRKLGRQAGENAR